MSIKRKPFQNLPANENPHFTENGLKIYQELKKKYPKHNDEDLDNILNSICASLIILVKNNVNTDNHKQFLQLIWKILNQNI